MEPIRKYRDSSPYDTEPVGSIISLQENIISSTCLIWRVISISYGWIDHDNLSLLVIMKVMVDGLHLLERKSLGIEGEYLSCQ